MRHNTTAANDEGGWSGVLIRDSDQSATATIPPRMTNLKKKGSPPLTDEKQRHGHSTTGDVIPLLGPPFGWEVVTLSRVGVGSVQ